MWRGIKACQKNTAIQIMSCDKPKQEVGRNVFLQSNFKRFWKLGKHPLSFSLGQLDPGSPRAGVPDSDRWGSVSRSGAVEVGGAGEAVVGVPERDGCHPEEKLWLIGLGLLPVSTSHLWPMGQPLCVHIFTPGQIARQARKSSPPIPASLTAHLPTSPPMQEHGTIDCLLTSSPSFPSFFVLTWLCTYISCASKHYLLCYGCITWPSYTWFYFCNSLYLRLMCALKRKK